MTTKVERVTEKAQRDALKAAYDVLAPLSHQSENDISEYLKQVLLAVKAVHRVEVQAQTLLDESADEFLSFDVMHIVASALWAVVFGGGLDLNTEVHPYSIGAHSYIGFAKACLALEALTTLHIAVDDDFLVASDAEEAIQAVDKAQTEREKNVIEQERDTSDA